MAIKHGRDSFAIVAAGVAATICVLWSPVISRAQSDPVYAVREITITPELPRAGEPTEICVEIRNPTQVGQDILVRFSCSEFGIGMTFYMITERSVYLPPESMVKECIWWVPPSIGPFCYQVGLTLTGHSEILVWRNIDLFESLEPLMPDTLAFPVRNSTPTTATVTLGLVPHLPDWGFTLSQDVIPNLAPGAQQMILLISVPPAELPEGRMPIVDVEAYIGGELLGGFRKSYPVVEPCDGARLDLVPALFTVNTTTGYEERGAFITAIRRFEACAIGMEIDLQTPQIVVARVYEADGTTRGPLVAEGSAWALRGGNTVHYVPLSFTFQPCQDYDIALEYGAANDFNWYDERTFGEPFDVGGAIRVRDGEYAGNATNFALPHVAIIGYSPGDHEVTDFTPGGASWSTCADGSNERGVYVRPHQTITISALQFAADFTAVPVSLRAYVFEGTGKTRGPMIATGTVTVTAAGLAMHVIPIVALLEEGKEYDVAVVFPGETWSCIDESQIALPFTAGGVIEVEDGEKNGDATNTILPHIAVEWSPGAGGVSFDLAKTTEGPPPFTSTDSYSSYGLYVTSLTGQDVYSLGWEADVTPGTTLYAWVYEAMGPSRVALISQGSTIAVEGETRWHDIPVAATLESGVDYNIEIGFGWINAWSFWEDYTGMPYAPYGLFEVFSSSEGGNPLANRIIHMRVNACNSVGTAVEPRAERPPRFTLDAPYPNPVSAWASVGYNIDEAGPVTITVYDVAGRRVAVLLDKAVRPVGPGMVDLDARGIAAGVYFVKMEMTAKSVARKITIVR